LASGIAASFEFLAQIPDETDLKRLRLPYLIKTRRPTQASKQYGMNKIETICCVVFRSIKHRFAGD